MTADQLQLSVPATPTWTVHDVLAHLVGCAADAASYRLDGAPGEQWTARHVEERRHRPVNELLAEWDRVAPAVESNIYDEQIYGPNIVADTICHESDLREALRLSRIGREHWQPFLDVMMLFLGQQLRRHPTLIVRDEHGQQWTCGAGDLTTLLRADGYELLRASYSRRSRRQIAAWNWTPTPNQRLINSFGVFGPRSDDQPIPIS